MDPIAVTAALLRNQLPDVPIREGASMMARVASRGESHAVIVIAGIPVTAELPKEIEAGATLKLKVKEVSAGRVWLQIDPQGSTAAPATASLPATTPQLQLRPRSRSRSRPAGAAAPTASPPTSCRSRSTRRRWAASTCAWSCAGTNC